MTKLAVAKVRENFSDIITQVAFGKERLVITRNSKELCAVIPIEQLRVLEAFENSIDLKSAKAALKRIKDGEKTVPWEKLKKNMKPLR